MTNAVPVPVGLASLEVLNERGRRISRLSGTRLQAETGWPDEVVGSTTTLQPFSVGVAWLDLTFAARRSLPKRVKHRLTISLPPGLPGVPGRITDTSAQASVDPRPARVIGAPLRGGRWAVIVGAHRRALQPINGTLRLSQRFATDWSERLDAAGRTLRGDPDRNASYFAYGQPVLAVGAGEVVAAVDRYPDQIPNHKVPVSTAASDGNHVILRLAPGVYAGFAHLKPGSVRVHRGQHVRAGQVLGRLGDSGNSTGPHLHFQLMNRPSFLDADGLPYVFDRFTLNGHMPSLEALLEADQTGTPLPINSAGGGTRRRQGLLGLEVLTLPGG